MSRVVAVVEQVTSLRSRWSGVVDIVPAARYMGAKPFDCSIRLHIDLLERDVRWRTIIHEGLHTVSAGYTRFAYETYTGWEEGVVEALQRLLRDEILSTLGVPVPPEQFAEAERGHAYNRYIAALEEIRVAFSLDPREYYLMLIATPINERYPLLVDRALAQADPLRRALLNVLSAARPRLED